ncbi:MAG TPA: BrnA antitoxin family protein, partial [Candidatus Acidoferrum sp.]|nr:BrnA antitoxin family protein [Candidatus Acidoferrum sp.]
RGAVAPLPAEKIRITIRLDRDIVDQFRDLVRRAHCGNYQTLINDALREHLQRPSLAQEVGKEVRSVVRQELHRAKASA